MQVLPSLSRGFYVYELVDADVVFYVGKGSGVRVYQHDQEAQRGCACPKCERIRAIWAAGRDIERRIVHTTNDEQEAYRVESERIALYGGQLDNNKHYALSSSRPRSMPSELSSVWCFCHIDVLQRDGITLEDISRRSGVPEYDIQHLSSFSWGGKRADIAVKISTVYADIRGMSLLDAFDALFVIETLRRKPYLRRIPGYE